MYNVLRYIIYNPRLLHRRILSTEMPFASYDDLRESFKTIIPILSGTKHKGQAGRIGIVGEQARFEKGGNYC